MSKWLVESGQPHTFTKQKRICTSAPLGVGTIIVHCHHNISCHHVLDSPNKKKNKKKIWSPRDEHIRCWKRLYFQKVVILMEMRIQKGRARAGQKLLLFWNIKHACIHLDLVLAWMRSTRNFETRNINITIPLPSWKFFILIIY